MSANRRAAGQRIEGEQHHDTHQTHVSRVCIMMIGMGAGHSDIPGYVLEQHARRTRHMIDKMRQYPSVHTMFIIPILVIICSCAHCYPPIIAINTIEESS